MFISWLQVQGKSTHTPFILSAAGWRTRTFGTTETEFANSKWTGQSQIKLKKSFLAQSISWCFASRSTLPNFLILLPTENNWWLRNNRATVWVDLPQTFPLSMIQQVKWKKFSKVQSLWFYLKDPVWCRLLLALSDRRSIGVFISRSSCVVRGVVLSKGAGVGLYLHSWDSTGWTGPQDWSRWEQDRRWGHTSPGRRDSSSPGIHRANSRPPRSDGHLQWGSNWAGAVLQRMRGWWWRWWAHGSSLRRFEITIHYLQGGTRRG